MSPSKVCHLKKTQKWRENLKKWRENLKKMERKFEKMARNFEKMEGKFQGNSLSRKPVYTVSLPGFK
jgi:hypothetical protein